MRASKVIMILSNPFRPDPRVYREAKSLTDCGFEVIVYAWDRECIYPVYEMSRIIVKRIRVRSNYGSFVVFALTAPIFWLISILKILSEKVVVVHCHNLGTMPVGVIVKLLKRNVKLIYDAHEYYPAMVKGLVPSILYTMLIWVDKVFTRFADCVVIPCEERRGLYSNARSILVVPNTPKFIDVPRRSMGEEFTIFYGGGLSKENGIPVMIEAAARLKDTKLVLAGDGPLKNIVRHVSNKNNSIVYLGTISQREVLENLAAAHATFVFYEPSSINNIYAASNKLFESMMVGVPVIINKETAPAKIVRRHECGIIVPYGDMQALEDAIMQIKNNPKLGEKLGENGKSTFKRKYAWELIEPEFVNKYKELLRKS